MKKVLKTVLKVILWLVPCAGTIICFGYAYWMHIGIIGALIDRFGRDYLGESKANNMHMKHSEFRELDSESRNKIYDKACDDARGIEKAGWKWWCK